MPMSDHVHCVVVTFKMPEWTEQWIYIKFCIKLEHSSPEIIRVIQKAFRDDAMSTVPIKYGRNVSKLVENLLKVIHILEGQQQAEHLRMFKVYWLQSTKICDWQFENQKLIWGFQKLLYPRFCYWIVAWNVYWHNLFPGFCTRAEGALCCSC